MRKQIMKSDTKKSGWYDAVTERGIIILAFLILEVLVGYSSNIDITNIDNVSVSVLSSEGLKHILLIKQKWK